VYPSGKREFLKKAALRMKEDPTVKNIILFGIVSSFSMRMGNGLIYPDFYKVVHNAYKGSEAITFEEAEVLFKDLWKDLHVLYDECNDRKKPV